MKLTFDESLSNCAFNFNLRRYLVAASHGHLEALERLLEAAGDDAAAAGERDPEEARAAGAPLVHFSAQPEPFLSIKSPDKSLEKC